MRLKDTGLTSQDIKDKVNKYMIETYERFDFLAERAKDMYMYDENGEEYLDFYAGIAVNNAGLLQIGLPSLRQMIEVCHLGNGSPGYHFPCA